MKLFVFVLWMFRRHKTRNIGYGSERIEQSKVIWWWNEHDKGDMMKKTTTFRREEETDSKKKEKKHDYETPNQNQMNVLRSSCREIYITNGYFIRAKSFGMFDIGILKPI